MQITLYNFKKRTNSCKQPASDAGTMVTCVLKDNCSLFNPVFELSKQYAEDEINYVKWGTRYYFVSDIIYESNSLCLLQCQSDVLASWRNAIGNSSQYVLRSASDCDPLITDNLYPAKNLLGTNEKKAHSPVLTMTDGFFVFGLSCPVRKDNARIGIQRGGITYIAMSQTNAATFITFIQAISQLPDVQILHRENPFDYVTSVMYIPLSLSDLTHTTVTGVNIELCADSQWTGTNFIIETFGTNQQKSGVILSASDYIEYVNHPSVTNDKLYLNYSPYTERTLFAGPFGEIDINTLEFDQTSLHYKIAVDIVSGVGRIMLSDYTFPSGTDTYPNASIIKTARVGVPISLTQVNAIDWNGLVDTTVTLSKAAFNAAQGQVAGAVTGALSGIWDAKDNFHRTIHSSGNNGAVIDMYDFYIHTMFLYTVEDDNADRGRPLCKVKTINTLSGYILCTDADIDFAGTMQEIDAVKNYMNTGFFYE